MKRFSQFEARDHEAVIRALRSKTVERGASAEEADSAKKKAAELEAKHPAGQEIGPELRALRQRTMAHRLRRAREKHEAMMARQKVDRKA